MISRRINLSEVSTSVRSAIVLSPKFEPAVGTSVPVFSDDECVQKLAMLMEHRDARTLAKLLH
ncbi:hypothetical protein A4A58_28130 [Tardiphaga robiniae]|uniref:Uncharacterized protein n=1 Tax=Tardiphaga robiniae TaxID=943830 RepID=A0A163Z1D8_9BRAD|nr:hypothetical protein A4A58_28130 [Tardiphaga robiniae]